MLRRTVSLLALAFLALSLAGWVTPVQAQTSAGEILVLTVDGPIEPAMQLYIDRGLQLAADRQAGLVIILLNTPGGSIDSMTNIYTAMRNSSVPVLVYVSPSGAMAASAGTLITLAGNLSAMAPQTTIGAASPVGAQGENVDTTEATKIKEIMKAAVRTFTQNRPPAATQAAEDAIDNATALNVDEALKIGLIDYKANDLNDLLAQIDGRKLTVQDHAITLQTRGVTVQSVGQTIIEQGLVLFTDPNLVFIFISLGTLAILTELANPGTWVPGTAGAILWLLGFFGLGILPVNWFGLLFMVLAFILFIVDIKAPTHGALTAVGAASFIAGALILFNSVRVPGIAPISVPLVVGTGLAIAGMFFAIVTIALRAQGKPLLTGQHLLLGRVGVVRKELAPLGEVQVGGEIWSARPAEGEPPLSAGTRVKVVAVEGLKVRVRKED